MSRGSSDWLILGFDGLRAWLPRSLRSGIEPPLATFLQRARHLHEKLGPLLHQLPPFTVRDDERLAEFLTALPKGLEHVLEFRHSSWFAEEVWPAR